MHYCTLFRHLTYGLDGPLFRLSFAAEIWTRPFGLSRHIRMMSFDYTTGKTAAISTTSVGGVARAYAFVPRAR